MSKSMRYFSLLALLVIMSHLTADNCVFNRYLTDAYEHLSEQMIEIFVSYFSTCNLQSRHHDI